MVCRPWPRFPATRCRRQATVTATDDCDGSVTVSFSESRTDGACPNSYTLTRTWTATDACGNISTTTQTLTVQDTTAPVLSGQGADATIESPATPVFTAPTATDNCDASPLIGFTDLTNQLCGASYRVVRTWTATDACGNVSAPVSPEHHGRRHDCANDQLPGRRVHQYRPGPVHGQ